MVIGDLKWPVNIHHLVHWEEIRIPYFFLEVTPGTMDEAYLRRMLTLRCAVFPYWCIGKEFGCLTFSWKLHLELLASTNAYAPMCGISITRWNGCPRDSKAYKPTRSTHDPRRRGTFLGCFGAIVVGGCAQS